MNDESASIIPESNVSLVPCSSTTEHSGIPALPETSSQICVPVRSDRRWSGPFRLRHPGSSRLSFSFSSLLLTCPPSLLPSPSALVILAWTSNLRPARGGDGGVGRINVIYACCSRETPRRHGLDALRKCLVMWRRCLARPHRSRHAWST